MWPLCAEIVPSGTTAGLAVLPLGGSTEQVPLGTVGVFCEQNKSKQASSGTTAGLAVLPLDRILPVQELQ